ncbi:MAG: 2-dehydropantoate 2-reductase [Luteolibacter sp.]|jgi:2-dehydropantoate 2-reductase
MSWNFQSTAIVGSGAIGLYYGARLAAAGEDVRFLVRSDADGFRDHGLRVESIHGDLHLANLRTARDPSEIGPVDLVVVAWKATANEHLEQVLPPLMHQGTQVLTLQNGLGNCEKIARITGPQNVLGGLCFVCINRIAPAHVRHTASGKVVLGEWRADDRNRVTIVAQRWKNAGIHATATPVLEQAQWEKLVWNIPFNGLSIAEGGVTTDILLANPRTLGEIREVAHEVVAAARALGHPIPESLVEENIERTRPMGPYRPSSMIDYLEGREVETDAIWAAPLRRAALVDAPMPATATLLRRIHRRIEARDAS